MREDWHGRYPRVASETVERMVELHHESKTIREIASEVGVVSSTVSKCLRKAGVPKRASVRRKKLSFEQRKELSEKYAAGATFEKLYREYGISNSVVESCLDEFGVQARTGWGRFKTEEWTDCRGRVWVFKSSWELKYAQWLDEQSFEWDYEPCKFGLIKCRCYTPDFRVRVDDHVEYHEVKGWLDKRTMNRLEEFMEMHADKVLRVIGPRDMVGLGLIEGWYVNHAMADTVSQFQDKHGILAKDQVN